jgi:hypothetical protein
MDSKVVVLTSHNVDEQPIKFTSYIEPNQMDHVIWSSFDKGDRYLYRARNSLSIEDTIVFFSDIHNRPFQSVWDSLICMKNDVDLQRPPMRIFDINAKFRDISCLIVDSESQEKNIDEVDGLLVNVKLRDELFEGYDWFTELRDGSVKITRISSNDGKFKDFILALIVGASGAIIDSVAFECALLENFSDRWRLLKCWLDSHALDENFARESYILEGWRCRINTGPYVKYVFAHTVDVGARWRWAESYTSEFSGLLQNAGCDVGSWTHAAESIAQCAAYRHIDKYEIASLLDIDPKTCAQHDFIVYGADEFTSRFNTFKEKETHTDLVRDI